VGGLADSISLTCLLLASSGKECLDTYLGELHTASLGSGRAWGDHNMELRKDYGNLDIGSCWESLVGSMFRQNGFEANTGALFLAYASIKAFFCSCFDLIHSGFISVSEENVCCVLLSALDMHIPF
jgi:hypothetical protein